MKIRSSLLRAFAVAFAALLMSFPATAQVPAFPGALGHGAYATGGRYGTVYHVTTLADSGAGSFRDAVSQPNRMVVFDVGGYVTINSEVSVKSHTTIAGQTAPGGGIAIRGREVSFGSQENIICRFVRFRPGSGSPNEDNGVNLYRAENVILDHVSIEFAKWNNIGGVSDDWQNNPVTSITFQNCIIANPLYQQFGAHTECVNGNWSWFYNIFANSRSRNPMSKINDVFVNNVLYNCSAGYTTHTSTPFDHDIVNNYFIAGPGSGGNLPWYQVDKNQSIYYSGNYYDSDKDGMLGGNITTPYWYQGPGTILATPWSPLTATSTVYTAANAYAVAVSQAGAFPRDQMDALVISQVKTLGSGPVGTGAGSAGPDSGFYSSQTQTGLGNSGFGIIAAGAAPVDGDQDGLPDYFETATGSDPTVPNHTSPVPPGAFVPNVPAGYTVMDDYLHFAASAHAVIGMNGNATADLSAYTQGFTIAPVSFTLLNVTNIGARLLPDGHTAQLIPASNFVGRAKFDFRVSDGAGNVMTQAMLVVVSGSLALPSAPSNLTADAISSSAIVLGWSDTSPNETGFKIERSDDGVTFSEIDVVGANVTTFTNLVAPQSTHYYRVRAYSLTGNSEYSNFDFASTPPGPVGAPESIAAATANSRVSVSWSPVPGAAGYKLKRSLISGSGYATIAELPGITFEDLYAVNGTTYYYVASAMNEWGEGGPSPKASATPSGQVVYQAEDQTYGGGAVFESSNGGFLGTGYVNSAPSGSYLQFDDLDAGGGGVLTLRFRNALGNTARTGRFIVNGVTNNISFASTGTWTTWVDKDVVATLNPGTANYVRFETTGQDLANIDQMTVFGTPVAPPPAAPFFDEVGVQNGNLVSKGFGGVPNDFYRVLESTNLALPLSSWTPATTNQLDANGVFNVTNLLDGDQPRLFLRFELP